MLAVGTLASGARRVVLLGGEDETRRQLEWYSEKDMAVSALEALGINKLKLRISVVCATETKVTGRGISVADTTSG